MGESEGRRRKKEMLQLYYNLKNEIFKIRRIVLEK